MLNERGGIKGYKIQMDIVDTGNAPQRGIEAYELLLKLEPTNPDAGRWVLQIADGYATLEDWAKLKATYARALSGYTAGSSWS